MSKIYLHIGTHKTATTLFQRVLSNNRSLLREHGIYYPNYNIVNEKRHFCHHDIARYFLGDSKGKLDRATVIKFFRKVGRYSKSADTIISSEIFYRAEASQSDSSDVLKELLELVCLSGHDPVIVLTIREQAAFLESLYREHVLQTKFNQSIARFYESRKHWFDYEARVQAWSKFFPDIRLNVYEKFSRGNFSSECLENFTAKYVDFELPDAAINTSVNAYGIKLRKILNMTDLPLAKLKKVNKCLRSRPYFGDSKETFLGKQFAQDIFAKYAEGNLRLFQKYGIAGDYSLFRPYITNAFKPGSELRYYDLFSILQNIEGSE